MQIPESHRVYALGTIFVASDFIGGGERLRRGIGFDLKLRDNSVKMTFHFF
jgi:hypothetical protein